MPGQVFSILKRFSLSALSSLQIFQIVRYATFVVVGIGFAKLHLPLSDIGSFETFIMLSGMVSFFWVSGTINTMLSVFPKGEEKEKKELLFGTFLSLSLFSIIAGFFLFVFSGSVLPFLDKRSDVNLVHLVVFYLLLNGPSFINEYILFLNDRRKELVWYALISSVFTFIAALLPVVLGYTIGYSMWSLIGVAGLKFLFSFFLLNRFASFTINRKLIMGNWKLSLPLILSVFVSGSAEYIDALIVKARFDDVYFAVFRYGARELPVLLIIANTLSTAMIPAIAGNLNNGMEELKRRSTQLMHFFFPLTLVLLVTSPFLFRYVFSESFVYSALIFNIYLLLIIPRVLFPQTVLTGMQKNKYLLVSSAVEIILNVSLSVWLAGKIGLPGIAAGTLVAYLTDKVFLIAVSYFKFGIRPSQYISAKLFCVYSVACCIAFAFGYYLWHG